MDMLKNKLKYGKFIADSFYLEKHAKKVIVFCQGIPGISSYEEMAREYVKEGFIFIHPKYIGSWESFGEFHIKNCRDSIIDFVNALFDKKVKTIFGQQFDLNFDKAFILGHSFGGSVALCAGADLNVDGIIAISPVINYRKHAKESFKEEDLSGLFDLMKAGFSNVYRNFKREEWEEFCKSGFDLNAIDYIEKLKNKKIFLIHGNKDKSVNYNKSRRFYFKLKTLGADISYLQTEDNHSNVKFNSISNIVLWMKQ